MNLEHAGELIRYRMDIAATRAVEFAERGAVLTSLRYCGQVEGYAAALNAIDDSSNVAAFVGESFRRVADLLGAESAFAGANGKDALGTHKLELAAHANRLANEYATDRQVDELESAREGDR